MNLQTKIKDLTVKEFQILLLDTINGSKNNYKLTIKKRVSLVGMFKDTKSKVTEKDFTEAKKIWN